VSFDDDCICYKCIAMSTVTSIKYMMNLFVTKFLPHYRPCVSPHHCIYDEHFCRKDFTMPAAMSHVINHVERHNCMNCDIFRHTYDKLECHRFSDNCGVRHKIYDDFLIIIIVVHLTRTFCDNDLFVIMASSKYKL
jgi:hypothetical protein